MTCRPILWNYFDLNSAAGKVNCIAMYAIIALQQNQRQ